MWGYVEVCGELHSSQGPRWKRGKVVCLVLRGFMVPQCRVKGECGLTNETYALLHGSLRCLGDV